MGRKKVLHYRTTGTSMPLSGNVDSGEIAVSLNSTKPRLYIKDTNNEIVEFVPKKYIDDLVVTASGILVEDSLTSDSSINALSSAKGKELNDRLSKLEESVNGDSAIDVKKSTLQFYKQLGQTNSDLKPYCDQLRESMINLQEFAKLGTGLFIHWGVYAVPAGNYTGVKQEGSKITSTKTVYNTEWIMRDLSIPRDVYKAYEDDFTAENWDTDNICKAASEAGMGYVIITIKHHDGFCLAPATHSNWDVRTAAARNTIIDELKDSCNKYGLKFGFYISQYWDWMSEGGFGLNHQSKWNGSSSDLYTDAQHTSYCNNQVLLINELVEKYQPYVLWYDPGTAYADKYQKIFRDGELQYYPHVITNDRLQYDRGVGDFGTGERTIYLRNLKYGEACFTMNDTWGYSDNNETKYFGEEKVFKQFLIYTLSYGQNCLMNIGPKADGSIPSRQIDCLNVIKSFTEAYGGFKNYKRATINSQPKWGYMIELEGNKVLCYVVTKGNPASQNVILDCVNTDNLESVDILTPNDNSTSSIGNNKVIINNLGLDTATKIGVVRLNYSMQPEHLDANLYDASSMVPSRVFPMKNGFTWDFTTLTYNLNPSYAKEHTTDFIWDDTTGDYNLTLNRDRIKDTPISFDDVTTVKITDSTTNEIQTLTYSYNINESNNTISLTNGTKYHLSLKCQGTESSGLYRLSGFTFSPEVIIIHPTSVNISQSSLTIEEEGSGQLTVEILPTNVTNSNVTWSSNDETIATVEQDGLVVGMSPGSAIITATAEDGGLSDTCEVIVIAKHQDDIIHATGIELNTTTLQLDLDDTYQLSYTITPDDTTYKNVEWLVEDESIATVNNGLITGIAEGTTNVKVKLIYDEIESTCAVTVVPIHPTGITISDSTITLIPGFAQTLTCEIAPANTTNKNIIWSSSDTNIAEVTEGYVFAKTNGTTTISASTEDGNITTVCTVTVNPETYDYLWEAQSLDGSSTQGDDTGITLFSDELTNWTLFGYVHNSKNPNTDNNATLLQCVVNASPWTGFRIDADNNNYPTATSEVSPLLPRFLAGTDCYINPINGTHSTSKMKIDPTVTKHPVCMSRNGNVYKYSVDGVNWVEFTGLNTTQIARLKECPLTVAFDYRRASGAMTANKYRFLKTDFPCCVSLKHESDYPFYTLYHKYDGNLTQ